MSLSYRPTTFSLLLTVLLIDSCDKSCDLLCDLRIFILGTDTVELLISYSQNDIMLLAGHLQQSPVES